MEPLEVPGSHGGTLRFLQSRLEERRGALRQVGESAPRPVLGNALHLEQFPLNLCLNPLEAVEPDGELTA